MVFTAIGEDSRSERRTDAETDDERSAPPSYNTVEEDGLVPPPYNSVVSETESAAQDTDPDSDECDSTHVKLHLSTSPPTSSASSHGSAEAMLPPGHID